MTLGACLCGTVRYELDGPFTMMMHCHCSMCRKHHGAPFATFVAAAQVGFRWRSGEDAVGKYASSPQGARTHCRHCGSVGPTLLPEAGIAFAPAGNLDGAISGSGRKLTSSSARKRGGTRSRIRCRSMRACRPSSEAA